MNLTMLGQDIENIHKQGYNNIINIKRYTLVVQKLLQSNLRTLFTYGGHVTTEKHGQDMSIGNDFLWKANDFLWNSVAYLQHFLHHLLKDEQNKERVTDLPVKFSLKHDRNVE